MSNNQQPLCVYPSLSSCNQCVVHGHCPGKGKYDMRLEGSEEEMDEQYLRWQQEMLEEEMKREVKEEEESDILDAMWLTVVNSEGFVNIITLRNVSSILSSLYRVICSGSKERCIVRAITYLNREER